MKLVVKILRLDFKILKLSITNSLPPSVALGARRPSLKALVGERFFREASRAMFRAPFFALKRAIRISLKIALE